MPFNLCPCTGSKTSLPGTIVFDPSVNLYIDSATEGDAFVYSYYPNANCGSSTNLYFGSYASNKVYRSLLKFDVSFVPEEAKISSAYLKLQL
ncbi:DNRLRE domain-containing protein [bacterium]|nr:DNRLRE domain-containing protein [bacterium]